MIAFYPFIIQEVSLKINLFLKIFAEMAKTYPCGSASYFVYYS